MTRKHPDKPAEADARPAENNECAFCTIVQGELDGLMWPRHKYAATAEAEAIGKKIRGEVAQLMGSG